MVMDIRRKGSGGLIAHASTHATGGSDELLPVDIGAAAAAHNHTLSDITDSGALAALDVITASLVDSGAATNGYSLVADGAGGASWQDVSGGGLVNAYAAMTDGTTAASASGPDTFKFRSANGLLTVTVGSNDATHGDNLLLTVNEGSINHDNLSGYVANEHIDWTQASQGTIHATNYVDNDTTDHTALSNIGTNTHAQIDTHISSTSNPHSVTAAQIGAIENAYSTMTDGTTSANASGGDTFKFRSANGLLTVAVSSNDVTHGDNLLLTVNEGSINHDNLSGYVANEHIDWTQASQGTIHATNYVDNDTTDHTALSNIGTNTHAQIDTHISTSAIHIDWTQASQGTIHATNYVDNDTTDHTALSNIGTNTHAQIDTHISSTSNPHSVTAAQVGAAESSHTHTLADVTDSGSLAALSVVTAAYIDSGAATNGYSLVADGAGGASWQDVSGGGISNAYTAMTDGTTTANASGSDTFKFRSANGLLTVAIGSNDATHGDNLLLTVNEGSINHDNLSGYVANEHIDWTQASQGTIHATNYVDNDTTDHTLLSNIGVNTHAQIDTHISSTSNPHSVTAAQVGAAESSHTHTLSDVTDSGSLAALNAVTAAEIDSGLSPINRVLTTDGAGGASWESSILSAYVAISDFSNTAFASGSDTITFRTGNNLLTVLVTSNDAIFGDNVRFTVNQTNIDHDALTNYVAAEHIDWTQASQGTIHATNYVDNDTTDHTALSNIGTNTHAQIDTHISSTSNPHSVTAAQVGALDEIYKVMDSSNTAAEINTAIDDIFSGGGYGIVYLKAGSYSISTTIVMKQNVNLVLDPEATLTLTADVNGIQMDRDAMLIGGVVDTSGVASYSKAAVYLPGSVQFGNRRRTLVADMRLIGDSQNGYGIHAYATGDSQDVTFVTFRGLHILDFSEGVRLELSSPGATTPPFINGNIFTELIIYKCTKNIHLVNGGANGEISGNMFFGIQHQGDNTITSKIIHVENALRNTFTNQRVWDVTKTIGTDDDWYVELDANSSENRIEIDMRQDAILDNGAANVVRTMLNTPPIVPHNILPQGFGMPSFAGNQDDVLAFAEQRHTVSISGVTPNKGDEGSAFNPDPGDFLRWDDSGSIDTTYAVVEVTFSAAINYLHGVGVQFLWGNVPVDIKIEKKQSNSWSTIYYTASNNQDQIYAYISPNDPTSNGAPIQGVRVSVRDVKAGKTRIMISRIFAFSQEERGWTYVENRVGPLANRMGTPDRTGTYHYDSTNSKPTWWDGTGWGQPVMESGGNMADNELVRPKLKDYSETVNALGNTATSATINLESGNVVTATLTGNVTSLTISNPPASGSAGSFTWIITQDGTGSRTITWPASVKWAGGSAPTLSTAASAVDILTFTTVDGGTTWYGFAAGLGMA